MYKVFTFDVQNFTSHILTISMHIAQSSSQCVGVSQVSKKKKKKKTQNTKYGRKKLWK